MNSSPNSECRCNGEQGKDLPTDTPCCYGALAADPDSSSTRTWVFGSLQSAVGEVPVISTRLSWADTLGAWKARWRIGRMSYLVEPGLYAVGKPEPTSPVLVSANYKMSFDRLRSSLDGLDVWLLVLDTKGINVWCAAGKGIFGTDELVQRIAAVKLPEVVSTAKLIVPQLGAPGVAAHEVKQRTGFRVVYGPVLARDIPAFLKAGMKATPEMRRITFPLADRMAVVPVELVGGLKYLLLLMVVLLLLAGLGPDGFRWSRLISDGVFSASLILGTFVTAMVVGPALLPWLPGRALSLKGALLGTVIVVLLSLWWFWQPSSAPGWFSIAGWTLMIPAIASFTLMNFTGSTTYTSLSGVKREMRRAVPFQTVAAVVGILCWLIARFVG